MDEYDETAEVGEIDDPRARRLVNLVLVLLSTSYGYSRSTIMERVEGYGAAGDAANRMFERDKSDLLRMGLPLESIDSGDGSKDSYRYKISPASAQLPPLEFSSGERAALQAALASWRAQEQESGESLATISAVRLKLEALGVELPPVTPHIELRVDADVETIESAIRSRRVLKFDYRTPGQKQTNTRSLQAWGWACRSGEFFVYGHDELRNDFRCFNLARITSPLKMSGLADSYEVGTVDDLEAVLRPELAPELRMEITLRIAEGRGVYWRRRIEGADSASLAAGDFKFFLSSPFRMIPLLAADAPSVVVLDPPEIRERVARLVMGQ